MNITELKPQFFNAPLLFYNAFNSFVKNPLFDILEIYLKMTRDIKSNFL